ncbi:MAG: citramalate synthase [Deltaproteobacteria bacterium]|jgi:2-isopropylmalate synthase|nr:citramalate synthase [Deltaproteobacteria bacterium]MCL5879628.1 citramalate synthase [Deltaproteobacteria bacterium]MDA8304889.1 citramalate synthase [Deltaproteobacteria bacterium]
MKHNNDYNKREFIEVYDTTLRDGTQGEGFSLSIDDKLMIAGILDELGVHFIEGGFPSSNPKDRKFFELAAKKGFKNSKLVAFGSTRRKNTAAKDDANLRTLSDMPVDYAAIFGKSWDLHVETVLKISLNENLDIIADSINFLKAAGKRILFDAEHFFDGFEHNEEYAVKSVKIALEAGAEKVILCDTNGGFLPHKISKVIERLKSYYKVDLSKLGIHTHNDTDCAVANTIAAVMCGIRHVQGTINGYGERTGNANLSSIIPNLELKLGFNVIGKEKLKGLVKVSRLVDEISNNMPVKNMPYVGESAFAHKAGMHANAVLKNPSSYEHIEPAAIGNNRRFLISDLSGKSNIEAKAKELGIDLSKLTISEEAELLNKIKELDWGGFDFESADGSFKILMDKYLSKKAKNYFKLLAFRVNTEKNPLNPANLSNINNTGSLPLSLENNIFSEAVVMIEVQGKTEHTVALGDGPVNALDNALRKALLKFYPILSEMKLTDFKVRVISNKTKSGTASYVRVLIESSDKEDKWTTLGVSENIIEASYQALADSITYKLTKEGL